MSKLADIFKAVGPYKAKVNLTVAGVGTVTNFQTEKEDRQLLTAVMVDREEQLAKLICYDPTKFNKIKVGNDLAILNSITKLDGTMKVIVVTKTTKVFMGQAKDVKDHVKEEAQKVLNPPPAELVPINIALSSPPKKKVSVRAKMVQEEEPQTVQVRGEAVQIKNIFLQDETGKAKVTLWRQACQSVARPGDYVKITNVVTNIFRSQTSLSTTSQTEIEKCEAPITSKEGMITAISIDDLVVELLMADDSVLMTDAQLLKSALAKAGMCEDLEKMLDNGHITITYQAKGDEICSISF